MLGSTSSRPSGERPSSAFVWVWLPGRTAPVVAGRLDEQGEIVTFTYGHSYLSRDDAIALYLPELPLQRGSIRPGAGLSAPGCIKDAGPDSWGQRIILARHFGHLDRDSDTADPSLLTYLLESGSDRIGALDFQLSATEYVARTGHASLAQMQQAADTLQAGGELPAELAEVLLRGTSIGGARPKVLLDHNGRKLIAKLSSTTDTYPVVKAEGVAMNLARRCGLDVAPTEVTTSMGRDVLLVERFDRTPNEGERRLVVSALTMLGLDEMMGRYATYYDLADLVRRRFDSAAATLRELFARIVFNVLVGNTDDHARNHAAFWNGESLNLTPAYDLCPQPRSGTEANQAMAIGRNGERESRLAVCRDASDVYLLTRQEATDIIDSQLEVITSQWADAADECRLTFQDKQRLWKRQILNDYVYE
ncbi:HipA domain-containing protein [Nocardioides sp. W7]|uniref:type II toxin-antitoxin system HipA family toxin n=1 Tax=Nocardioides sp. W7 TaxID=2931390 RepID=UPI001FD4BFFC|nr:HipA domain-containing protein [Nocardioides sp. W7]